jgi:hypothetical protein
MVLIQMALISLVMKPVWPAAVVLAVLGGLAPTLRLLLRIPSPGGYILAVLVFIVRYRMLQETFTANGYIGSELAYEAACCCVAIQVMILFMDRYEKGLPVWYLGLSTAGMVFAGDMRVTSEQRRQSLELVLGYYVCWAAFASANRAVGPPRRGKDLFRISVLACMISVALTGCCLLSVGFQRHEGRIEQAISRYLLGTQTTIQDGFSGAGGLSDISNRKRMYSKMIALRIQAESRPDYLRGKAFDLYADRRWNYTGDSETIIPSDEPSPFPARKHDNLFLLQTPLPGGLQVMTIWPIDTMTAAHCFLPLEGAAIACDSRFLKRDQAGIVQRFLDNVASSYQVATEPARPREILPDLSAYLQLPELDSEIVELADSVVGGPATTIEKVRAVESFFHENFHYDLNPRMPRGVDRLKYFLLERSPAHCEYFATAAALMLRLGGVPTRYVTGFVVTERNTIDGNWIARRKDAHAWVEAYDSQSHTWLTVEATPSNGVPGAEDSMHLTWREQLAESLTGYWGQLWELAQRGVFWDLGRAAGKALLWLILIVLFGRASLRLARQWTWPWKKLPEHERELARLTRERSLLDQFLARHGVRRVHDETVLSFASRVERESRLGNRLMLARWYRDYSALRYQGIPLTEMAVERMRSQRKEAFRSSKAR